MSSAVGLRADFTGSHLRAGAIEPRWQPGTAALGAGCDLRTRHAGAAAVVGSIGLQTVREWVFRFNRGLAGLVNGKAPGQRPLLEAVHKDRVGGADRGQADPGCALRGELALIDLIKWLHDEYCLS